MSEPKYEHGNLVIDVGNLLDTMDVEAKKNLAQSIGIERDVIAAVVDQLIDGYTANDSWSGYVRDERVRLMEKIGDGPTRKAIKELLDDVARHKAEAERMTAWAYSIYRGVEKFSENCNAENGCRNLRYNLPPIPESVIPWRADDAEIDAKVREIEAEKAKIAATRGGRSEV